MITLCITCLCFIMSINHGFIFSSDGGSDSSVSDGLPVHLQYMADKVNK